MKCLLFAGATNTGKSKSIYNLAKYLIKEKGYKFKNPEEGFIEIKEDGKKYLNGRYLENTKKRKSEKDVAGLMTNGKGFKIIIQSYNDSPNCLNQIETRLKNYPKADLLIIANRNKADHNDDEKNMHLMTNTLLDSYAINPRIEIPLGRMLKANKRDIDLEWYSNSILQLSKNSLDILLFPNH